MNPYNVKKVMAEVKDLIESIHYHAKVVLETTPDLPNALDDAQKIVVAMSKVLALREMIDKL